MPATFKSLGLSPPLLKAIQTRGYETPTPIQTDVIPLVLQGKDVLGCAQTGTGKTAAFALPAIEQILADSSSRSHSLKVLVLSPTRELAIQINECFDAYSRHCNVRQTVIHGGVGANPQIQRIRKGMDVVVATPGRLLDLHSQGHLNLDSIQLLVIDEADMMLDMGFIQDVSKIVAFADNRRQTLLFSATLPSEIQSIAADWLNSPTTVNVVPDAIPIHLIKQSVFFVENINKDLLLIQYLFATPRARTLVFVRTKQDAERVARNINRAKLEALPLHGNKSQGRRRKAIEAFKSEEAPILVATDVAARGLDIDNISHVINYALPEYPEIYIHRVGRTGRAGCKGEAISLCASHERYYLENIEQLAGISIKVSQWNYDDFGNVLQLERAMNRRQGKQTKTAEPTKESPQKDSSGWVRDGRGKKTKKKKNKRKRQSKIITMDDINTGRVADKYAPQKKTLD
ncbi:MAG: DEAD/DEAH box helicase [Planctomycetaceae bacterium]|nr:DEAD/DEAH box helicase [Planctomycetaceae bacterium]|tara:strand:- start:846 stop:2222 length:1377 start_codon:yes stop_codon:yes gene_type:complete